MLALSILIASAVLPAIFLLRRVYRADRLEKEPRGLLRSLVLYGILATLIAGAAEELGALLLTLFLPTDTALFRVLFYFVLVGGAEEGCKFFLLRRRTWNEPEFNCLFDGVVYAVFVSLGFALWENIRYVFQYGLSTALLRAVTAVPGHACFGVFMGVWYAQARRLALLGDGEGSRRALRLSLLVPLLLHGVYDYIATLATARSTLWFLLFVAGLFAASDRTLRRAAAKDAYL